MPTREVLWIVVFTCICISQINHIYASATFKELLPEGAYYTPNHVKSDVACQVAVAAEQLLIKWIPSKFQNLITKINGNRATFFREQ